MGKSEVKLLADWGVVRADFLVESHVPVLSLGERRGGVLSRVSLTG
jgi:hypothetical protein